MSRVEMEYVSRHFFCYFSAALFHKDLLVAVTENNLQIACENLQKWQLINS